MTRTPFFRTVHGGLVVAGLLLFALWGMRPAAPVSADPACDAMPVGLVGYVQTNFGSPVRVDVQGDYAYLVEWWGGGLEILDISNPCQPVIMGSSPWYSNEFQDVKVAGDYAYVANDANGLAKYDVSDPTAPVRVDARHDSYGEAVSIDLAGSYALVSQIYSTFPGLVAYDLTTFPAGTPATYTMGAGYPYSLEVDVEGDRAYLYNFGDLTTPRFQILDISTLPNPPVLLGSLDLPADTFGYGFGIRVVGDYAYLASPERIQQADGGLVIVNVADDSNPFVEGMVTNPNTGLDFWKKPGVDVDIANNMAYIPGVDGLYGYNVADPSNPVQTEYYPYPASFGPMGSGDVFIRGDYAYVSAYYPNGNPSVSRGGLAVYKLHVTPPPTSIYLSPKTAGTTGDGLAFGSEDILRWDGSAWSRWFDGSAAGLVAASAKHNINAFWIADTDPNNPDMIISFAQNSRYIPGILPNKVDGMDLVSWDGSVFSLVFDGSDVGLTNMVAEKIDGLHVLPGSESPIGGSCQAYLLISTQGAGAVPRYGGGVIKFSGEDVLGFCMTNSGSATAGFWHMVLDGSAEGLPINSVDSISLSDDGGTLYLTTGKSINVVADGVAGGHSMVYSYDFGTQAFSGPHFSAPAEGLMQKVDGLQVEGDLP